MRVSLVYLPCCPVPNCLGKQGGLSGNCLPNLTVRFILSVVTIHDTDLLQGSDEVDEAARHSAHDVAGVAVLGQQERQLQHEVLLQPHLVQFTLI